MSGSCMPVGDRMIDVIWKYSGSETQSLARVHKVGMRQLRENNLNFCLVRSKQTTGVKIEEYQLRVW